MKGNVIDKGRAGILGRETGVDLGHGSFVTVAVVRFTYYVLVIHLKKAHTRPKCIVIFNVI